MFSLSLTDKDFLAGRWWRRQWGRDAVHATNAEHDAADAGHERGRQ